MAKIFKPTSLDYRKVCKDFLVEGGKIDFTNLGVKDKMEAIKLLQGPGFGTVIKVREYLGTQQENPEQAPVVLLAQVEATCPGEEYCNLALTWVENGSGSLKTVLRKVSNLQPVFKTFAELPKTVFPPRLRNSCLYWQGRMMDRFRNIINFWDDPNDPQYAEAYGGDLGPDPFKEDVLPPEICPECGTPLSKVNSHENPDPHRHYCENCNKYFDIYHNVLADDDEGDDDEEEDK